MHGYVNLESSSLQIDIHCERSGWEDTGVAIAQALGLQVRKRSRRSSRVQTLMHALLVNVNIYKKK
jgi:hypothetical protein